MHGDQQALAELLPTLTALTSRLTAPADASILQLSAPVKSLGQFETCLSEMVCANRHNQMDTTSTSELSDSLTGPCTRLCCVNNAWSEHCVACVLPHLACPLLKL